MILPTFIDDYIMIKNYKIFIVHFIILGYFYFIKNFRKIRNFNKEYTEYIKNYNSKFFNNLLPENIIKAIILVESNANPIASGSSGEIGLMQIMPSTFRYVKEKYNLNFDFSELYNPKLNILTGMFVFYDYAKQLNFNVLDTIRSYNVGVTGAKKGKGFEYLKKVWKKL